MPKKGGVMTPMERSFAKHYATTSNIEYSATKAGFAQAATGYRVIKRPAVQELVDAHRARLKTTLLGKALDRLEGILDDKKSGGTALVQSINTTFKYALGEAAAEGVDKEPHEMTGDEIARRLASLDVQAMTLQAEAAERAKPINDLDMFG